MLATATAGIQGNRPCGNISTSQNVVKLHLQLLKKSCPPEAANPLQPNQANGPGHGERAAGRLGSIAKAAPTT